MSSKKQNNKEFSKEVPKEAPKIALVIWEDACQPEDHVWVSAIGEREYKPHIFWQVGFILKDFPEGIHMSEAWSPSLVACPTQIPRGMVRSIQYL